MSLHFTRTRLADEIVQPKRLSTAETGTDSTRSLEKTYTFDPRVKDMPWFEWLRTGVQSELNNLKLSAIDNLSRQHIIDHLTSIQDKPWPKWDASTNRTFDILCVQIAINEVNGNDALQLDGIIGPRTKLSVQAFQKNHKLTEDGVPGPQTIQALLTVLKGAEPKQPTGRPIENWEVKAASIFWQADDVLSPDFAMVHEKAKETNQDYIYLEGFEEDVYVQISRKDGSLLGLIDETTLPDTQIWFIGEGAEERKQQARIRIARLLLAKKLEASLISVDATMKLGDATISRTAVARGRLADYKAVNKDGEVLDTDSDPVDLLENIDENGELALAAVPSVRSLFVPTVPSAEIDSRNSITFDASSGSIILDLLPTQSPSNESLLGPIWSKTEDPIARTVSTILHRAQIERAPAWEVVQLITNIRGAIAEKRAAEATVLLDQLKESYPSHGAISGLEEQVSKIDIAQ